MPMYNLSLFYMSILLLKILLNIGKNLVTTEAVISFIDNWFYSFRYHCIMFSQRIELKCLVPTIISEKNDEDYVSLWRIYI